MKIKVQYLKQKTSNTTIIQQFDEFDTNSLTIGRATDQNIFLKDSLVALKHARIYTRNDNEIHIESFSATGIQINGRLEDEGLLKPGDKIMIASYVITVFPATGLHDLTLMVEQDNSLAFDKTQNISDISTDAAADKKTSSTTANTRNEAKNIARPNLPLRLSQTRLKKRSWSWALLLCIPILFMAMPLIYTSLKTSTPSSEHKFSDAGNSYHEWLSYVGLSDKLWLSGPISHVHQHFGNDCNTCHQVPFQMVQNEVCMDCHQDTNAHVDPRSFDIHMLQKGRCGDCHREHNGSQALKPSHQVLCANCHAELTTQHANTKLMNASDFGQDHPEFRPRVRPRKNPTANQKEWLRIRVDHPKIRHQSGLKFPHKLHLRRTGLDSPDTSTGKRVLECSDCHQLEAGGAYFLPVSMEAHCQSCHQLNFDPEEPGRVAPHGNLAQLKIFLDEFYALQALQGAYENNFASANKTRRRPNSGGKPAITTSQRQDVLRWAQDKSSAVTKQLIEVRSCSVCHDISPASDAPTGWSIDPIYASAKWFSMARFNHAKHSSATCNDCHKPANKSSHSSDILLPKIDDCRVCHGGEHAEDKYASSCITCHQFHIDDKPAYSLHTGSNFQKMQQEMSNSMQGQLDSVKENIERIKQLMKSETQTDE